MELELKRLKDDGKGTIGTLSINGEFVSFTLEDTFNEPKVYGKTRIPDGEYELKLRTGSPMANRYKKRFGDTHKGMLWLQDVPDFTYVYIHVGNREDDTDGCILVGSTCSSRKDDQYVAGSVLAYTEIYPYIADAITKGEKVTIKIAKES